MYIVYLLGSINKPSKTYVGLTVKPIEDRLREHNEGLSTYTKTFRPWKILYFETFYCRTCAEKREIFLKSGIGYKFRKLIAENYSKLK